jgi:uncharacterized protein (DUF302 family)
MSREGLITIASGFTVRGTIDRLVAMVTAEGLIIFARIDHAGNAAQLGLELRPTELLIFGNPRAGTPLMQDKQTIGIDLPVKALSWEDGDGNVWLTYSDATWLAKRHGLGAESDAIIKAIAAGLAAMSQVAAGG